MKILFSDSHCRYRSVPSVVHCELPDCLLCKTSQITVALCISPLKPLSQQVIIRICETLKRTFNARYWPVTAACTPNAGASSSGECSIPIETSNRCIAGHALHCGSTYLSLYSSACIFPLPSMDHCAAQVVQSSFGKASRDKHPKMGPKKGPAAPEKPKETRYADTPPFLA